MLHNTLLTLFFSLLLATLGACSDAENSNQETVRVRFVTVQERPLALTASLPGRVSPYVISEVRPQVDGIIRARLFKEGSFVSKDQVLYQIDPAVYEAAFHTAQASLAEARANMDVLALQVRRYRALARDRAISQQSLENTVASYAQAKARVDRAEAELESARINLAYTRIKAPISGRIGASAVTAGALVTANQASALATIQHLDQVYIDMTQPVVAALKLRREMALGTVASAGRQANRVRLTLEDGSPYVSFGEGGKTSGIEGELLFSESIVNESTATVSLRAVFANPDHVLLPGMYVTAHIETGTLQNAVLIPQRCVLSSSMGEHFVFVIKKDGDDGRYLVERRPVALRRGIGSQWLLEKGLAQGDLVVVDGLQKVSDGSRVLAEERMDAQGVTPSQPRPNVTQEK